MPTPTHYNGVIHDCIVFSFISKFIAGKTQLFTNNISL